MGRLLIYRALPDLACNIVSCGRESELLVEVERKLLGFDHADVGGELLRAWKLPERLAAATAFHHRPECSPTPIPDRWKTRSSTLL